jgi:hypothetical protein
MMEAVMNRVLAPAIIACLVSSTAAAQIEDTCVAALANNVSLPAEAFSVCGDTGARDRVNEYLESVSYEEYQSTPAPIIDDIVNQFVEQSQASARWYEDAVEDQERRKYVEDRVNGLVGGALVGASAVAGPAGVAVASGVVELAEWWKTRNQVAADRAIDERHRLHIEEGIALLDRFVSVTSGQIEQNGVDWVRVQYDAYIENTLGVYGEVDVATLEENLQTGQEFAWALKKIGMTEEKLLQYVGHLHDQVGLRFDRQEEISGLLAQEIFNNQTRVANLELAGVRRDHMIAVNARNISRVFEITAQQGQQIERIQENQDLLFESVVELQARVETNTEKIRQNTADIGRNYVLAKQNEQNIFLIKNILFGTSSAGEQLQYLDSGFMDDALTAEQRTVIRQDVEVRREQERALARRQRLVESIKKYDQLGTQVIAFAQTVGIFGDHADDVARVYNVVKSGIGAAIAMISDPSGISIATGVISFANSALGSFFGRGPDLATQRHQQIMDAFAGINHSLENIGNGIEVLDEKINAVIEQNNRILETQGVLIDNQVLLSKQLNTILDLNYRQYEDLKGQLLLIYDYITATDRRDIDTCYQAEAELLRDFENFVFIDRDGMRLTVADFRNKLNQFAEGQLERADVAPLLPHLVEFNQLDAHKPFSMFRSYDDLASAMLHNVRLAECLNAIDFKYKADASPDRYFDPVMTVTSLDNSEVTARRVQYRANLAYVRDYGADLYHSLVTPSFDYAMAAAKMEEGSDFSVRADFDFAAYDRAMNDLLSPHIVSRLTEYLLRYHRFYALTDASRGFAFLSPAQIVDPSSVINDRAVRKLERDAMPTLNVAIAQATLIDGEVIAPLLYEHLTDSERALSSEQLGEVMEILRAAGERGYRIDSDYGSLYRSSLLINFVRYHIQKVLEEQGANFFAYGIALEDTSGHGGSLMDEEVGRTLRAPGRELTFKPVFEPVDPEGAGCREEGANCRWFMHVSVASQPFSLEMPLSSYVLGDQTNMDVQATDELAREVPDASGADTTSWRVPMPSLEAVRDGRMHMHPIIRRLLLLRQQVLTSLVSYKAQKTMNDRAQRLYRSAAAGGAF